MNLQDYLLAKPEAELTVRWHSELNEDLRPTDVSPGSHIRVWWQCAQGHSWQAPVYSVILNRCDCPYCSGRKAYPGETDLVTTYPAVAAQWDAEKNGEIDPHTMLPSSHQQVWWRCDLGHSWQAAPFSRTREKGAGCPYCTGKKVLKGFNDLITVRPALATEWYQPLNGDLTPADVSPGSNKKVWWRCDAQHVWKAAIYARAKKNGTGCPVCAGTIRRSHVLYGEPEPNKRGRSPKLMPLRAKQLTAMAKDDLPHDTVAGGLS